MINNALGFIFIVVILFIPQAKFDVYFSIVFSFALFVFLLDRNGFQRKFPVMLTVLVSMFFIYAVLKSIIFNNIYDLKEMMKVFLFLSVFFCIRDVNLQRFSNLFFLFLLCDFVVSLMQFSHISTPLLSLISETYNTQNHAEFSLQLNSVRSLGLSPGPGQHGVLALFSFWFFIVLYVFDKNTIRNLFGSIFSLSILLMSQSKTAIIAFLLISILFFVVVFLNKGNLVRCLLLVVFSSSIYFVFYNFENILMIFYDINRIVESGLNVSSMSSRFELWEEKILLVIDSNLLFVLFGAGRSYLEFNQIHNSSFDSDYVYLFVCYGFFGFFVFFGFAFRYLMTNFLRFGRLYVVDKILYLSVFSGIIVCLSLDYFTDLKIISLLAFLFAISRNRKLIVS